jgi:hydrogenase maturation protease
MKHKSLVLGIGNDILRDDGIGPKLAIKMEEVDPLEDVAYQTTTLGGLDILELIQDYQTVVFIDAIKTRGGVPGTVYEYSLEDFQETLHLSNLHDISFLTAIELGKKMNMQIPDRISIIAVEIVEDMEFGEQFTPPLQEKYPAIIQEVKGKIRDFLL